MHEDRGQRARAWKARLGPGVASKVGHHDLDGDESTALSLREELTDIQYGRAADKHGWMTRLDA